MKAFFLIIIFIFLLLIKTNSDVDSFSLGIPFNWITIHKDGGFTFQWIGFIFNILIFYLFLKKFGSKK